MFVNDDNILTEIENTGATLTSHFEPENNSFNVSLN